MFVEEVIRYLCLINDCDPHFIPHLLNDLSIMDCHGLASFCHGIQYLTMLEIMNTPNFRKLGFLDKEDDNDTVKQFQGLRSLRTIPKNCKDWLKISHIPKGDVKEPSQDDSEEPSEGMPALQWSHPQYISGLGNLNVLEHMDNRIVSSSFSLRANLV
ncbi:hypothetical protein AAG906_021590 [Vitis piasezkii]